LQGFSGLFSGDDNDEPAVYCPKMWLFSHAIMRIGTRKTMMQKPKELAISPWSMG